MTDPREIAERHFPLDKGDRIRCAAAMREYAALERQRWVYCPKHGADAMKPVVLGDDSIWACTYLGCRHLQRAVDSKRESLERRAAEERGR